MRAKATARETACMRTGSALRASIALTGLDAAFALAIALLATAGFAQPAWAYVDPSVMTYTIQALAGVAVALSAVLGVVWRRLRKKAFKLLNIDENAHRQVDAAVHRISPDDPSRDKLLAKADEAARAFRAAQDAERPQNTRWGFRFALALAASAFLAYTVGIVAPFEIVIGGADSLYFGISSIWIPLTVFSAAAALICALAASLVRGKAFNVVLAVIVALGIGCYIQAVFLNTSLPTADGTAVNWGDYTSITAISGAVWLVLLAAAIVFALKKASAFKSAAVLASIVLAVVQTIGLASLATSQGQAVEDRPSITMQGAMDISDKSNVVLFVLDTFDTRYLNDLRQEHPDLLDEMTGFTYFPNSTGSMIPTRYAMASMLTDKLPAPEDSSGFTDEVLTRWYAQEGPLDDIAAQGYSLGLYSGDVTDGLDPLAAKAENIRKLYGSSSDWAGIIMTLEKCALYRDLPWVAKPPFWFYTDEMNNAVLPTGGDDLGLVPYTMDDAAYYRLLTERGLAVREEGRETGLFRLIHLAGAHSPYIMDENAQPAPEGTTLEQQCRGALEIVNEYLRQMKALGVYDQSTIIVTADHGEWYLAADIHAVSSPIFLVKPATEPGGSASPCRTSLAPTGHVDLAATLVAGAGGDASGYGPTAFEVPEDQQRTRYYYSTSVEGPDHDYTFFKRWEISGDALDFSTWRKTGEEWPITDR